MAAIFGPEAAVLQLNQAFAGVAQGNAVFNNQVQRATSVGDSAFAIEFGARYVPSPAESPEDFADLAGDILTNLNLAEPYIAADKAAELAEALPLLLFAYKDAIGQVVLNLTNILVGLENDPNWGAAARQFNGEQVSALVYSTNPTNTTSTPIDGGDSVSTTFTLTVGQDTLAGTGNGDTFKANVVQNALGAQVNSLGSGDSLDGQAGTDSLLAKITAGVFAGGSSSMPIQPETSSIEVVKLQAVPADVGYDYYYEDGNTNVFVNAKDMTDVQQLWSDRSDADLTIMNLTTVGLDKLSDMTIGMAYSGNRDSRWAESDYTVYFDQDYLTPEATRTNPSVDFLAMNEDNYDATDGEAPLDGVFFRELQFRLNGEVFDLTEYLGEDPDGTGSEITTYDEFLAAVQAALVELKADNPDNAALQTMVATFGQTFRTDVDPVTLIQREGVAVRLTVDGLTNGVANELSVRSTDLEVARAANATVPNNNRYEVADDTPPVEGAKLAINVALEKVGLAGDGGELIIGSMNKTSDNEWGAVNTTVDGTTSGIEEFNVTVYGDDSKSSSLAGLHSTNNNLRVVTVATDSAVTGADGYANLTIGNSNTDGLDGFYNYDQALKDVQTFDASAFMGDLTLYAGLTDEVTVKYLNLVDQAPDAPAADNVEFDYIGGSGNDSINVTISANNGAFSGAVTREDFDMSATIAGGDGDDMLTLAIIDNGDNSGPDLQDSNGLAYASFGPWSTEEVLANWYDNQRLTDSLRIDGGKGDDTIWTPGSGNVTIDAGVDDDTVYTDNTGRAAVWALNVVDSGYSAVRHRLDNLQSDANDSYNLFKTDVQVSFLGFEATAAVVDRQGVATDLDINQAIKKAINSHPVLSTMIEATDGPANTLVISSLIDGEMELDDLVIELVPPTAAEITAGDAAQLAVWYATPGLTPAAAAALIAAEADVFNSNVDEVYNQVFALNSDDDEMTGTNSLHTSDNVITPDLGDDVIVLGTGRLSNDTIVYEGFGNGRDSIVNFDVGFFTVTENTVIDSGREESFTITFSNLTASTASATVTFDGITVQLNNTAAGLIPARDVALAFAEQFGSANWVVDDYTPGSASVSVVATAVGERTDVVPGDFTFANATGSVTLGNYVQGLDPFVPATPGTAETFTVEFDPNGLGTDTAVIAGTPDIVFDGRTIDLVIGDGAVTVAQKVAAGNYTNWIAELGSNGTSVEFTARTVGDRVNATAADFNDGVNGVAATLLNFVDGTDPVPASGTQWVLTETTVFDTDSYDYLDFSDYGAVAVVVNGALVAGETAVAGEEYVLFTESTTNPGEYNVEVYTEAGATDTLVGLVGTLDFGASQDFVETNFII